MKKIQGLIIILGIAIFLIAAMAYLESKQYPDWQSVQASLESLSVQNASSPTVAGASDWGSDVGRARYRYKVQGVEYVGSRIMPLQNVYLPKEMLAGLSKGNTTVYFNPGNPAESFIYANTPATQIAMLVLAGILVIMIAFTLPWFKNLILGSVHENT